MLCYNNKFRIALKPSYNVEQLIFKFLVKHASKKKVSPDSILPRITKTSATNFGNETLKLELDQMIIKGLTDQNVKILDKDRLLIENTEKFR